MSESGTATISLELKVSLTDLAKDKLVQFLGDRSLDSVGLRVGVLPGGCSGAQYDLQFAEGPEEGDVALLANGVKVWLPGEFAMMLNGVSIDFEDALVGGGFKVQNPNASSTCGCGKSFS